MQRDDIIRALKGHDTVPRRRSHSEAVIRMLDATPCDDCGEPVGSEARGMRQCLSCLKKEMNQP